MSKYTFIDVETALNASESTPRSNLPWHSVFGQTKSNKEQYARLVGDNYSQFGGVGNKTYNSDNISACGAKWSDPTNDSSIGELALQIFAAKATERGIALRNSVGNINPKLESADIIEVAGLLRELMSRTFLIPLARSDANDDKILSMAKRAINQWEKESAIVLSTTGVEDLLPYQAKMRESMFKQHKDNARVEVKTAANTPGRAKKVRRCMIQYLYF